MKGEPGQAEGCLVPGQGASRGVTPSTGTEAEELERPTRREDPGLHLEPSHCPLQYLLQVWAQNTHSEDYAAPLELQVVVTDENDNAPICPPRGPSVSIPELSPPGGLWALLGGWVVVKSL